MAEIKISRPKDLVKRRVVLSGLSDIMFDRYAGDNNTKLDPEQKLYLDPSSVIGLPAANIMSSLSAHNTNSMPKRLRDVRKYKQIANACLSFVSIGPGFIPFRREGEPIKLLNYDKAKEQDLVAKIYLHRSVARLDKGIPNPKIRPVLSLPWDLEFDFTLFPNSEIKEQEIINLFTDGGIAIGLGTYRGVFGKFEITSWD